MSHSIVLGLSFIDFEEGSLLHSFDLLIQVKRQRFETFLQGLSRVVKPSRGQEIRIHNIKAK